MNAPGQPAWFVGDLDDPWVAAIAEVLPKDVARVRCDDDWPALFPPGTPGPETLILHRPILTALDADRLAALKKERTPATRVILCTGPHARYVDLDRCAAVVDAIVSEATASDTILRHLRGREERDPGLASKSRPKVGVVSENVEWRRTLADACLQAGYRPLPVDDWGSLTPDDLAIWDVPVLEPDWARTLERRSRQRGVIAVIGFPDRALVRQARAHGAAACLESPCELADLAFVLDRLSSARVEPAHAVPPGPASRRKSSRTLADPRADAYH